MKRKITKTEINQNYIPEHIAIIMDGNGRWAQKKGKIRTLGHRHAMKAVKTVITHASDLGVKMLTLYAFSTENWKRPVEEVAILMDLVVEYLMKETREMKEKNVRLRFIGDITGLSRKTQDTISFAVGETENNTGLIVNIALNYGGRAEIVRASRLIASMVKDGKIMPDQIDADIFEKYLYTGIDSDVDLMIRTGGEIRLSNFLIWQVSYAELYFTDILWPDFTSEDLDDAIRYYQHKNRRFGGL